MATEDTEDTEEFQSALCFRQDLLPKQALSQILAFVHQADMIGLHFEAD